MATIACKIFLTAEPWYSITTNLRRNLLQLQKCPVTILTFSIFSKTWVAVLFVRLSLGDFAAAQPILKMAKIMAERKKWQSVSVWQPTARVEIPTSFFEEKSLKFQQSLSIAGLNEKGWAFKLQMLLWVLLWHPAHSYFLLIGPKHSMPIQSGSIRCKRIVKFLCQLKVSILN